MDVSEHRFFDGFPQEAREHLLACIIWENYADGAAIFKQGAPADGVYLVLKGEVEIASTAGDYEKVLDQISTGDYFGEVAVLDGLGRSASARARGETSLAKIPGSFFLEVLATGPGALTLRFLKHVLIDLRRATKLFVEEVVRQEKLSVVGQMASSLMHDLRVPVSSVRLSADLIHSTSHDAKIPHWCDGIRLQCDRIVGMAAELMEFSKGESGIALGRTTTTAFLDQFRALNEGSLVPSTIEMRLDAKAAEIEIDSMRMQRVLQNLVSNAVAVLQHTSKPQLDIDAWVRESTFFLAVKDNGPGIAPEIQGKLFEPFVTHGKSEGIGLGMTIVRNIVLAHGGEITFDTAPDHGTTFLVRIPQR